MVRTRLFLTAWVTVLVTAILGAATPALAQQQFRGLCALVKIQIQQELALERIGFLATLEITNNEAEGSITDFSAALTFANLDGEDASDLFFVRAPELSGINDIDGNGVLRPGETFIAEWFIIPKPDAGGTTPDGVLYEVGVDLSANLFGEPLGKEVLQVFPDTITVQPDPRLTLTYFQPRDVTADNPFTPEVESPIPFTLGVLIQNNGFGPANSTTIKSAQPRIVENNNGLLLVPRILGARVDDEPRNEKSLTVNFGDIPPNGGCRKGAWDMITTLSGEFTEFKASYTHAPELGGEETSVIEKIEAFFISREVRNDQPGRDDLLDFLAITDESPDLIPNALYESDCNVLPVNHVKEVETTAFANAVAVVDADINFDSWVYMRLTDPADARWDIVKVERSDGKELDLANVWTNIRFDPQTNERLPFLNIFDFTGIGQYQYTITYSPVSTDTTPPVTTVRFDDVTTEVAGRVVVKPGTKIFLTAEDESPVSLFYRFAPDTEFSNALPRTLRDPGLYEIDYFGRDAIGNEETPRTILVEVPGGFPDVGTLALSGEEVFAPGGAVSVRPRNIALDIGASGSGVLSAMVDIFQGVYGFPTLANVPFAKTSRSDVSLIVGGENVDFYRFRINNGPWSASTPVSQPLDLTGLSDSVLLDVEGREARGGFTNRVSYPFEVKAGEPLEIVSTPAFPTKSADVTFEVNSEFFCFRIDAGAYRPETSANTALITDLEPGEHIFEALPRADAGEACPGNVDGQAVTFTYDRLYGDDLPAEALVFSEDQGELVGGVTQFVWDATADNDAVVPPGFYSIRTTITDSLDLTTAEVSIVEVGDIMGRGELLAEVTAPQLWPDAFGDIVVWQDQRAGNWDIFLLDRAESTPTPTAITSSSLNDTRPRTDGRSVVWQARQADGNIDVAVYNIETATTSMITATPAFNESEPVVSFPWVVFERKSIANPDAPTQLIAHDLRTGTEAPVDATTFDQVDAAIDGDLVAWQDFRDAGPGEIYAKNLRTGTLTRVTNNPGGQQQPDVSGDTIIWGDNRNGFQLDIWAYDVRQGVPIQLTDTSFDEQRPRIKGSWIAYTEDSAGGTVTNLRVLNVDSAKSVQLTNVEATRKQAVIANGFIYWIEERGPDQLVNAPLPDLQPVFDNNNMVSLTAGLLGFHTDAYSVLRKWNEEAGVVSVSRYSQLLPQPVIETAALSSGTPTGPNFALQEGGFLWVEFDKAQVLDLGIGACAEVDLISGVNVVSFSCFPDDYSAYQLLAELGTDTVNAVRVLDAKAGRWSTAVTSTVGNPLGEDFDIGRAEVVLIETNRSVADWVPGSTD